MKKFIRAVSFLGLALIFGNTATNAQSNVTRVDADIPFDFVVGDEQISAGKYVMRISSSSAGAKIVTIVNADRELVATVLVSHNGDRSKTSAELVFDRSAGVPVLAKIITDNGGYSMPTSAETTQLTSLKKAANDTVNN